MAKVVLNNVASGYGTVDVLNANFDAIEAAFENTLFRDGRSPNQMSANLDMNDFEIINARSFNGVTSDALEQIGDLSALVVDAEQSASEAALSASEAAAAAADAYTYSQTLLGLGYVLNWGLISEVAGPGDSQDYGSIA